MDRPDTRSPWKLLDWLFLLLVLALLFGLAQLSHGVWFQAHSLTAGFLFYGLLGPLGETLERRINHVWGPGHPQEAQKADASTVRWFLKGMIAGLHGFLSVLMFYFYSGGTAFLTSSGFLPGGLTGFWSTVLTAFWTALIWSLTYAPLLTADRRLCGLLLESRRRWENPSLRRLLSLVDWPDFFINFYSKDLPVFWLPCFTLLFALPTAYWPLLGAVLYTVCSPRRQFHPSWAQPE